MSRTKRAFSMGEVLGAVIATSLVLMAVFVPVCFMPGVTGKMYQQFALCIAVSIGLSTVAALTLAPALCSTILKSADEMKELDILVKFDNWFNKMRDKYLVAAKYFIDNTKTTLIFFGTLVIIICLLFKIIPTSFLPEEDKGAVFMQVQLPDGVSLARTDDVSKQIEENAKKIASYSSGNKTRLFLASLLARETKLLVLDEPDAALDPLIRDKLNSKFREYIRNGNGQSSILFSTHNVADMENMLSTASKEVADQWVRTEDPGIPYKDKNGNYYILYDDEIRPTPGYFVFPQNFKKFFLDFERSDLK